ncbi:hypothetical protein HPB50_021416 [Hyalomma asiaticum]|uniref:Uncharacterized protein n=1 Tax=Hyalomma asiaticum TaxID=266040 RepID=A0ACB7RKA9_HYAAI|nr:hypothetical protein HPB50_021416 [Hyalomma asiaticum]
MAQHSLGNVFRPGARRQRQHDLGVRWKLKPGFKLDDRPHQVRVAGELALVVVPVRAMQCLRCHGTGHVRRDCRVPRCLKCRRYGHAEADCVRTYASVTGVPKVDDSDKMMDVAEAEEAARGTDEGAKRTDSPDTSAHADGHPPNGDVPASQGATNDTTGSKGDAPAPQVHPPASSGGDTGNSVVPARERQEGVLAGSSEMTVERGGVHMLSGQMFAWLFQHLKS